MAIQTWTNGYVLINAVDLSNHGHSLMINFGQDTADASTFGDSHHKFRAALGKRTCSITFFNDYAAGNVEATLRALIVGSSSTGVTVAVRPSNSATTAVNPEYSFPAILDGDLNVISIGAVGGLQDITANFVPYGAIAVYTSSS